MITHLVTPVCALLLAVQPLAGQVDRSTPEEALAKIYDLTDFMAVDPGAAEAGPDLILSIEGFDPGDLNGLDRVGAGTVSRLIRVFIEPPLRADEHVLALGDRMLAVLARRHQHEWIERLLGSSRGDESQLLRVSCRLYEMPEKVYRLEVAPAIGQEQVSEEEGAGVVLAPGAETEDFLSALARHEEIEASDLPGLSIRPLTTGLISRIDKTAYLREYELEEKGSVLIAEPVVDVVRDGISISFSAMSLEGGVMGLSLGLALLDLEKPIADTEVVLREGLAPVRIQLPQISIRRLEVALELQGDHFAVLSVPPMGDVRSVVILQLDAE